MAKFKKVSTYQTSDGKLFPDKKEAQAHEISMIEMQPDDSRESFEKEILEILSE